MDDYAPFAARHKKFNPIEITRGCLRGCKFCQASFLYPSGGKSHSIRHRSVENICRHVKTMITESRKRGDRYVRFISPNAFAYGSPDGQTVNLSQLEKLLKSIRKITRKKEKIFFGTFPSEVRPEHVNQKTINLIKKYCDNDNLSVGAQSGSPRILKKCRRGHTTEDIYRAVKLIIKNGLKVNVDFIFGLPGEKREDMEKTMEMMEGLIKMGAKIRGHIFMPLAGTPYAKEKTGKLPAETVRKLEKLFSMAKLSGDWKKQADIAARMERKRG